MSRHLSITVFAGAATLLAWGCDDGSVGTGGSGGSGDGAPVVTKLNPAQPPLPGFSTCEVVITENAKFEGHTHRPVCTPLTYGTNPPTSGDHWPVWAMFKTYGAAVPREMLVHNLEHGAIVLLHKCASSSGGGSCADVENALADARTSFGSDVLCVNTNPSGPAARFVIAPDPLLATPIAISAWRASYTATCIDKPSIDAFVSKHYGKGTEAVCADGKDPADPLSGVPACAN